MKLSKPNTANASIIRWVDEMAKLCQPDQIFWCDGSASEKETLTAEAVAQGVLIQLNQQKLPGCYYHRSTPDDVARSEDLCAGGMKGRTMYVVPYLMGPPGSPLSKVGIELTDSIYVVLSMRIVTRMGQAAYDHLGTGEDFNRGLHCMLNLDPQNRYIAHFPRDNAIISTASNYGGNVLLGKKCLALRIGSFLAQKEGWLAEHMLILSAESPT